MVVLLLFISIALLTASVLQESSRPQKLTLCRVYTPKRFRQLQVKDLPKVPTWRLERDSNQQPSRRKTSTLPMRNHASLMFNLFAAIHIITKNRARNALHDSKQFNPFESHRRPSFGLWHTQIYIAPRVTSQRHATHA